MGSFKEDFSETYLSGKVLICFFAVIVIGLSVFLFNKIHSLDHPVLHLYFVPLLMGLTIEYWRISRNFKHVLYTILGAYVLSFSGLLPGKNEHNYVFNEHLEDWPYWFLGCYLLIATAIQYNKVTQKMTEGVTLLLTLAFNYWIFANDYWFSAMFIKVLIGLSGVFSLYAVFNAFSYRSLSKMSRLRLSIWSSIVALILAVDNFLKIYKHKDIENMTSFSDGCLAFLQFFLLGISSMYIVQNITMIGAFLPGKDYLNNVREIAEVHIGRYSDEQVYISDAVIVSLVSLSLFYTNYEYQFLPVNFMIWALITITPLYLYLINRILR